MWPGGVADWIVLGSGYLLALGLFYWLGGFHRAGEAISTWGRRSSSRGAVRRRPRTRPDLKEER